MAKFRLNSNSVFSIGGNAVTCLTSADFSQSLNAIMSECAGNAFQETVAGLKNATITVNFELSNNDVTLLGNVALGTNGAIVFQPNGTTVGDIKVSSTSGTIVDGPNITTSTSGLTAASITVNLDNVTIAANT